MKEISIENTDQVGGGLSYPGDYPVPGWPPGGPDCPLPGPDFPPGGPDFPCPRPWPPIFESQN